MEAIILATTPIVVSLLTEGSKRVAAGFINTSPALVRFINAVLSLTAGILLVVSTGAPLDQNLVVAAFAAFFTFIGAEGTWSIANRSFKSRA